MDKLQKFQEELRELLVKYDVELDLIIETDWVYDDEAEDEVEIDNGIALYASEKGTDNGIVLFRSYDKTQ